MGKAKTFKKAVIQETGVTTFDIVLKKVEHEAGVALRVIGNNKVKRFFNRKIDKKEFLSSNPLKEGINTLSISTIL